jgi:hypothetical protein
MYACTYVVLSWLIAVGQAYMQATDVYVCVNVCMYGMYVCINVCMYGMYVCMHYVHENPDIESYW